MASNVGVVIVVLLGRALVWQEAAPFVPVSLSGSIWQAAR
jgi:hypothetical protein